MNENQPEKMPPVPPFVRFVASAVPMVFDDSLSYYEALCALWKYVQGMTDVINNNATLEEEYIEKFNELKTYVDTYFDNLDVQEEINNKLDDMVEQGTLQEIITQYIQANTAWCFDTVAGMKAAENLINGSFAQTLGYNTKNDGGAGLYKIRTITNDDVVDEATIIELADDSLIAELIIPDEITPQLFGAVGDGTTDDTAKLRQALKYCIDNKKVLYIHKPYYITTSLLSSTDYNTSQEIHIKGDYTHNSYVINNYGGIKFLAGIDVFNGVTLTGKITGVVFTPTERTQTGTIFKSCNLNEFTFDECYVSNILAFMYNTEVAQVSVFSNSRFLTVYYFAKCDGTPYHGMTDSRIEGNYINGGEEMNDNTCFQFVSWNGSTVINNFIDYYRTIYEPYAPSIAASELPTSIGNHYQVFRYLYWKPSNISSIIFDSNSDTFNWNDPTKLAHINSYQTLTYTGHDTQTHDVPPYIGIVLSNCIVNIKNAYLQDNLDNIVFIREAISGYNYGKFNMTVVGLAAKFNKYMYPVTHADSLYNNGTYKANLIDLPFSKNEATMPAVPALGWTNYYLGQRINVNNGIYRLVYSYTDSAAQWVEDHSI